MQKTKLSFLIKFIVIQWMCIVCFLHEQIIVYPSDVMMESVVLKKAAREQNTSFVMENLFPGDTFVKEYHIEVNHQEEITLYYQIDITSSDQQLAEAMEFEIQVLQSDVLLYDGLLADIPDSLSCVLKVGQNEITYRITAHLSTAVGNEYQGLDFSTEFRWWYMSEDDGNTTEGSVPETSAPETDDSLDSEADDSEDIQSSDEVQKGEEPPTGDFTQLQNYMILMLFSVICLLTLSDSIFGRKKGR